MLIVKKNVKISKGEKITPKTFLKQCVFTDIPPAKKRRKKVSMDEFDVLDFKDYDKLIERNYNVKQLKSMCRFYKQRLSGNKGELTYLLYNYLKYSNYAIKIQSFFRAHIVRYLDKLKGPAFNDIQKCVNETDFYTLEDLKDLDKSQFYLVP